MTINNSGEEERGSSARQGSSSGGTRTPDVQDTSTKGLAPASKEDGVAAFAYAGDLSSSLGRRLTADASFGSGESPSRPADVARAAGDQGPGRRVDILASGPEAFVYSDSPRSHFFALELGTLFTESALGRGIRDYSHDFWRRKGEFLASVLSAGVSLELRLTSRPNTEAFTHGSIAMTLIGRVVGRDVAQAAELAREVQRLQRTTLPEYQLYLVTAKAVEASLQSLRVADTAELRRRVEWVRVDTWRPEEEPRLRLGFSTCLQPEGRPPEGSAAILHVFPFNPSQAQLDRLFELLLASPGRVCISFRVEPATLCQGEATYLESQIALCECHAQTGLRGAADDLTAVRPTLQVQARNLERLLSGSLDRMRRRAAVLRVWLAADRKLGDTLVHQVGTLLSPPVAGGRWTGDARASLLVGGYEVVRSGRADATDWLAWEGEALPAIPGIPETAARLPFLFPLDEAAGAFQLPPAPARATLGIETREARELVPPHNLPTKGLLMGRVRYHDSTQDLRVAASDRQQHLYVCGQTGTGKSTLLAGMILADIRRGEGVGVIDPHGDLYQDVLSRIPPNRAGDVVLIDPTDKDWPVSVNPLEVFDSAERHFAIDAFVSVMETILQDQYGPQAAPMFSGPVFWQQVRMNLSLLTHDPERPATLVDFCGVFQENGYWKMWTPLKSDELQLHRWVENVLPRMDFTKVGSDGASMGAYVGAKFESFVFFPPLRSMFGRARSTIDFRKVLNERKILLVNLAKGHLTDTNARFLGMVLLAKLQAAAMSRVATPKENRRPFYLYVDEFGTLATRFFASLLSEGRKFGISLVLANQFTSQIRDEVIREAIFGNVGSMVAFRTGHDDAVRLAREFYPGPRPRDFVSLPNWRAYARAIVHGRRVPAFVLETIPLVPVLDELSALRVRAFSRAAYSAKRPVAAPVADAPR